MAFPFPPASGRRLPPGQTSNTASVPSPAGDSLPRPPDHGFFLPGPDRDDACLLVHGSAGTAGDMRLLGEYLHRRGYTVLGVALPGHETRPADLAGVGWEACYATVRKAWQELRAEYRRVHVIGFSFGGTLTLHLAAQEPVESLILLAPALFVHFRPQGVLTLLVGLIPGTQARARVRWYVGLSGFLRVVAGNLPRVECPLLAIHAADDRLIQVKSSLAVCRQVSAREHQLKVLPRGGHLLPYGDAREEVWAAIGEHLAARRAGAEPSTGPEMRLEAKVLVDRGREMEAQVRDSGREAVEAVDEREGREAASS